MQYSVYLKPQQKLLLKTTAGGHELPCFEAITAYLVKSDREFFELSVPYELGSAGESPFREGMHFSLLAEAFGLGIQMTGDFVGIVGNGVIRIRPHGNMEVFSRREYPRVEVSTGVHCMRGKWTLRTGRSRWHAAVKTIEQDSGVSAQRHLVRLPVNLSAGGIRLSLKGPVQSSELCLVLIDPADKQLPICALCEVAWTGNPDEHELLPVGLRFVNILQDDRKRIDSYVREQLKLQGIDVDEARSRMDLLDLMQF